MQANYKAYDFEKSRDRIDEILDSSDNNYEDKKEIPNRENLTFTNGYYVYGSAIFVDMRGSKEYATNHRRPVLAKVYRSYISELIAILNSLQIVRELYIEGDCVWAIYNTPLKKDVNDVFSISAKVNSLIDTLNIKLKKRKYTPIKAGTGVHYSETLMIKAGYSGSGINEVTWIGNLVSETADLCSKANKNGKSRSLISNVFYNNLNEDNKKLLSKCYSLDCYEGNYVNIKMNEWVEQNG
ncbi:TPA: adenylate/guanylate cyclase domain-containing protein [Acinetobacter baumannii]|uniref:adenylate/guanylate cyclase domain-containing protein n=1 Tax=Acinetobacter baumannii TaxID=470 RepID=UPI0003F5570F|nr:adenylate/guanylate cyclase domain-containing protein [Acinetobacter baumannii]MDC4652345.1 adenylate/guanylate cyclase domain-containing protein [Acinetobacter baumannii]RSP33828.1 adenylate/guanylate cyclase domain-containing protein [Acinetobacter baumannii]HBN5964795.1 adenylate/guanylate cyclase domain-containing protein [Acinetobacter baumannii]